MLHRALVKGVKNRKFEHNLLLIVDNSIDGVLVACECYNPVFLDLNKNQDSSLGYDSLGVFYLPVFTPTVQLSPQICSNTMVLG